MTDFKKPYLAEIEVREPREKEVMVKVMCAPINPSDNYFVIGQYGNIKKFKEMPVGVGFSGAGVIEKVGKGVSESLIGSRVSINQMPSSPGYIGTFRKYTYMNVKSIYPFPESLSFEDIANSMGANPITVAGFMDIAERDGHSVFINDAAASSLGKMFSRYCIKHNKTLINIVRRPEQVKILEDDGAKLILNSGDISFEKDLKDMIKKYNPTCFFDAISGDFPGKVLAMMPEGSTMYVYGALSMKQMVNVDSGGLIFKNHTVSNFWIPTWLKNTKKEVLLKWMQEIIQDMVEGGKVFGSKVIKSFPIDKFDEAMQ